jgi:hypothetical protein
MAFKIVQDVVTIGINSVGVTTSDPISLKSGYIRLTPNRDCHIAIGTNPSATIASFMITAGQSEILKERVARQKISGITTGTSTIVTFGENFGNPFIVNEYATIENATPAGINTSYNLITAVSQNPITGQSTVTLAFNSTAITGIAVTNAVLARSIKVSGLSDGSVGATGGSGVLNITEVQITSQA